MAQSAPGRMHLSDLRANGTSDEDSQPQQRGASAAKWKSKSVGDDAQVSDAIDRAMQSVNELKAKAQRLKDDLKEDDFGRSRGGRWPQWAGQSQPA